MIYKQFCTYILFIRYTMRHSDARDTRNEVNSFKTSEDNQFFMCKVVLEWKKNHTGKKKLTLFRKFSRVVDITGRTKTDGNRRCLLLGRGSYCLRVTKNMSWNAFPLQMKFNSNKIQMSMGYYMLNKQLAHLAVQNGDRLSTTT